VIEMPVLDNALLGCAIAFAPLLVALTFGEPAMRAVQRAANLVPRRRVPFLPRLALDWVGQDPKPSAALMQGLFFGEVAPHRSVRRTFEAPTLIIGHPRDPVHPFSDADMLAHELPNARLVNASSILELRLTPQRLTAVIGDFVDECRESSTPASVRRRAASA
jgi:pimeloyl-ACP methyl ester carboxylesterase